MPAQGTLVRPEAAEQALRSAFDRFERSADELRAAYAGLQVRAARLEGELVRLRSLREQTTARAQLAAVGETAACMAHQLRNPLNAILGFARLLERELAKADHPAALRCLEGIVAGAEELSTLSSAFLARARLEHADRRDTDLAGLCAQAIAAVGGEDVVQLDLHLARACVDPLHLKQALINLLENALQATHRAGPVRLRVRTHEHELRLVVEDEGPGLPAELTGCVGTAFATTKAGGSGIGLVYAQRVACLHGGRLLAENLPEGGARFTLVLAQKGANA
ncbi:MAG: sensor histidine kinase [Planctomycetota bacterium]|nr:MAG: sensor histidine kinase [Planctomycetota bacterium]